MGLVSEIFKVVKISNPHRTWLHGRTTLGFDFAGIGASAHTA
jgi:hypothetical protein